jgi:DNA polymerase delta subunit 2
MGSSAAQLDEYLAVVSGLSIGTESQADAQIQMLVEYLSGEVGGHDDQTIASQITRLIIAGNSLSSVADIENATEEDEKKAVSHHHQIACVPHILGNRKS